MVVCPDIGTDNLYRTRTLGGKKGFGEEVNLHLVWCDSKFLGGLGWGVWNWQ